ncbi:MAG: zinc ribbon domain-containing protein [Clostridium sp.]|nr:zinc ribbon domain-containing protein [Clostridium sp.]MBO6150917.1 zinc ribbon domain-containing protein [Clostridium sp.]
MICRNCGAEVDSGEAFCPECGAKMEKRAAGDTLAMRMSRRELEERVSWQRLRKRVRRVAKLVGIMLAFVLFFGGGSFAVQEVLSRYDVGKYLGKLGMEDIAESLGIEVPVTEAAGEETETDEDADTDASAPVAYETDGVEGEDDAEEETEE